MTIRAGTHWRLCRLSTLSRFCRCFVAFVESRLSPACLTLSSNCQMTTFIPGDVVSTLSLLRTNWRQSRIWQLVAVDIVAKVEHFPTLSKAGDFLSFECRTSLRHSVDFVDIDKIGCVEFDFVAIVYRAWRITRFYRRIVQWLVFETKFLQLGHREVRTPCLGLTPGGLIGLCPGGGLCPEGGLCSRGLCPRLITRASALKGFSLGWLTGRSRTSSYSSSIASIAVSFTVFELKRYAVGQKPIFHTLPSI